MAQRITGQLTAAATGAPVSLRSGRGPRIIVGVHAVDCAACAAYVARLCSESDALEEWGARVSVVAPRSDVTPAEELRAGCAELLVAEDGVESALDVEPPALVVADEWGEVYFSTRAAGDHEFPAPAEVVEWIRFIAIQCPECENPEGEWRTL